MRARTINERRAYIFDFDETLVKTDAKIDIYRNGAFYKSLTPKQFNFYKQKPYDKLDFSDFDNGELILKAKKYKMWPALQNINKAIKENRSTSDIYILTARTTLAKPYIYEFLKQNGINININNIFTIGDKLEKNSISIEKRKILKDLSKKYDITYFFDDNPDTIKLANNIKGVKTRLVENKNKK